MKEHHTREPFGLWPAGEDGSNDPAMPALEPLQPPETMEPEALERMQPGERPLWAGASDDLLSGLGRRLAEARNWLGIGCFGTVATFGLLLLLVVALCALQGPSVGAVWVLLGLVFTIVVLLVPVGALLWAQSQAAAGRRRLPTAGANPPGAPNPPTVAWAAERFCAVSDRSVHCQRILGFLAIRARPCVPDPLGIEMVGGPAGRGDVLFGQDWQGGFPARRRRAVTGLFGIQEPLQVERLVLALAIRRHARPAPAPMIHQDNEGNPDLEEIAAAVTADLGSGDPGRHAGALAYLLRLEPTALDVVAGRLAGENAIRALGIVGIWRPLGAQGVRVVARGLDGTPDERHAAAMALRRLGRPALVSFIENWSAGASAQGLGVGLAVLDDRALADALAAALLRANPDAAVALCETVGAQRGLRGDTVTAWAAMGEAARDRLLALVLEVEGRAGCWAAEALGLLFARAQRDRLRGGLSGADPRRFPIAALLAHLGDPAGIPALVQRLQAGDADTRQVAAKAIGCLGAQGATALDALRRALRREPAGETSTLLRQAIGSVQAEKGAAPVELEAARAPIGTGVELQAAPAPTGTGVELQAGPNSAGPDAQGQERK